MWEILKKVFHVICTLNIYRRILNYMPHKIPLGIPLNITPWSSPGVPPKKNPPGVRAGVPTEMLSEIPQAILQEFFRIQRLLQKSYNISSWNSFISLGVPSRISRITSMNCVRNSWMIFFKELVQVFLLEFSSSRNSSRVFPTETIKSFLQKFFSRDPFGCSPEVHPIIIPEIATEIAVASILSETFTKFFQAFFEEYLNKIS